MATAEFRIEEGEATRWRRMTAIALASVLVCTVVLALMLAPRWLELTSLAASARDQQPIALPSRAAKPRDAPTDTGETAALGSEASTDSGKPVTGRSKAHSSIDAQTLAAARARGEVLAGKRAPVTDSAPSVAARENDATAIAAVVADEHASRVSESSDRPQSSTLRSAVSQSSAPAVEPLPAATPRVEPITLDSRVGSSQSPKARAVMPRSPNPSTASPPTPTARFEPAQTSPSDREVKRVAPISRSEVSPQRPNPRLDPAWVVRLAPATGTNRPSTLPDPPRVVHSAPANETNWPADRDAPVILGFTRAAPQSPQRDEADIAGTQTRVSAARAAPPSPQQDAAAARLDDSWERRERWLRDRLQTR